MSRKRYVSTDISIDTKLNRVSELAALLYTWMLPHAADNCRLSAKNAEELRLSVMPGRRRTDDEVEAAVDELIGQELIGRDGDGRYYFPAESFYKYQTYIKPANRSETPPENTGKHRKTPKISEERRTSPENAGDQQKTPESTVSLSLPLSPSLSLKAGRPEAPAFSQSEIDRNIAEDIPKPWHATFKALYQSDSRRFALLFAWCIAAEHKGYAGARVADALDEFKRYDAAGKVESWARYLDTLIDRRTARANAREFEAGHDDDKQAEAAWAERNLVIA